LLSDPVGSRKNYFVKQDRRAASRILELPSSFIHTRWGHPKIPHDAKPRKHRKDIVGDIYLPPVETLALRARIVVVVVVPPLSERNKGQK
jgi:hypothetical protein